MLICAKIHSGTFEILVFERLQFLFSVVDLPIVRYLFVLTQIILTRHE